MKPIPSILRSSRFPVLASLGPRIISFGALSLTATSAERVASPNGSLVADVDLVAGRPMLTVNYKGKAFIEPSPLGLESDIGSFSGGLTAAGSETRALDERYQLPHGKVRDVHHVAKELVSGFTNAAGDRIDVIVRTSNHAVALCYRLSSPKKRRVVVNREATGFDLPNLATAFVTPQVKWGGGFAASKPSYEEGYRLDQPVGTKSGTGLGFTFPALFRVEADGWMLISETGVSSGYVGTRLGDPSPEGLYQVEFPDSGENAGVGGTSVSGALPFQTSWKTLTIGDTLAPIVESTVATDVVKPIYEASQEYRPGRATWSWLVWQDASMNLEDQRKFIKLAVDLGYEYILVDAWWDKNIGRERMAQMVKDAAALEVGVMLWYNSNGSWNDAPQSPLHCMDSSPLRRKEMAWMKSVGVKGIKVDFFGGDKQVTMKLYEDILTDADSYGLMVSFHGATLPRGWERMYPNHMTSEAVTASENLIFSQSFADQEALNSTILPFVRNPVAAMDYGPLVLNKRFSKSGDVGTQRRTTDTFQLATAVLYQSPLQHFGLVPENLVEQPQHVVEFLKKVPTTWDETRYIDGYPGEFVVIARRKGTEWHIAATHAGKEQRELSFFMPELKGKSVKMLCDGPDGRAEIKYMTVGTDGAFLCVLAPGGGVVIYQ